ncbi:MAG: GTP-binding protein [Alphaproteobacteria bacterium]|nr:GTP-binding protein [Alphaproteobacteria bacterium]MBV8407874.1 GTP-binding protein [Alphaproteobacteria bacterium]
MSLFDPDKSSTRLPVSLITGFLGSGKTTLLNRVLGDPRMAKSLVLVNEFGEVGLDHLFMQSISGDMVLLQSGCVCCTIQGDLDRTLRDVARRRERAETPPFDRVLLETTGLADPAPILQLLLNHPMISHDYRLDSVIATVDAVNGARQLDEHQEAVKQAAVADRLLISKTDLAEVDSSARLRQRLGSLNPGAPLFEVVQGDIDPALLFDSGPFDPAGKSERVRQWLNAEAHEPRQEEHEHEGHGHEPHEHHDVDRSRHDAHIASFCLTFEEPLDWDSFNRWLMAVRAAWGDRLLRVKGVLDIVGESQPLVIHGVHRTFHPPTLLARWPDQDRRSRLVFITRDLDRSTVEASWQEMNEAA